MSTNLQDGSQPTVVLVHGAFADASSCNAVVERPQADGIQGTAAANPLRGIPADSAYIVSLLASGSGRKKTLRFQQPSVRTFTRHHGDPSKGAPHEEG